MQEKVDHRLLERFRAKQQLNAKPGKQPDERRAAAVSARRRLPAIDLRD